MRGRKSSRRRRVMADRIKKAFYWKLPIPDRPGEGARVLRALKDHKVNLLALSAFPRRGKTQMDFVPANAAAFQKAMRKAGFRLTGKRTLFLIQGGDRPGAVHGVMEKLSRAGINVTALEAVADGKGYFGAMFWVKPADVRKTAKALGIS
jgi:hypothetical protein